MFDLITNIPAFIDAHWAQLLALGAATTALNRFVQFVSGFIAKRATPGGKVANGAARVANVCNTITIDLASFTAELLGFLGKGPRAKDVAKTGILLLLALALPGCTSTGHLTPEAKGVVTTVADVAERLCLLARADSLGVSPERVAADLCKGEKAIAPFLPYVLAAKRDGAAAAGLARDAGAP